MSGRAERVAQGRALRQRIPRSSHAAWAPAGRRPAPLELLAQSQAKRLSELEAVRWARMLASPFTFLRGSAMVMAWDVAHLPHSDVYVQACGDAHLCNFGVFATPERQMIFDLRDFDETLPAPWEWDVKRLAASIVVAARGRGLSRAHIDEAVRVCLTAYRETMRESLEMTYLEVWYRRIDASSLGLSPKRQARRYAKRALEKARRRTSHRELDKLTHVVDGSRRIKQDPPIIFSIGDEGARAVVAALFGDYVASLPRDRRVVFDRYRLVDVAYRVVGVGSVGTRCMIALLCGDDEDDPLFLQMKEAGRSVLEPFARRCAYANQGERVVQGQRIIQAASDIFLGWKTSDGHDYYVRQLKDMKGTVDIAEMPSTVLVLFARLCGRTLAQAHARSGDFCQIAGYLGKGGGFDDAITQFSHSYADQVERDHESLVDAVRRGQLPAEVHVH